MVLGSIGPRRAVYNGGMPASWPAGVGSMPGIGWSVTSVNEGSYSVVQDEEGGLLQVTTDTADNDNWAMFAGPYQPSLGEISVECRLKIADITTGAVCLGFSETLSLATPVMPAEFATATMSYNGSGGLAVWQFDSDGTTDTWRAAVGDGGAVDANADANGTATTEGAAVNDEFDIFRVELGPTGKVDFWHNGKLVKTVNSNLVTTDLFHAFLMIENRSAAASVLELDYAIANGPRDWSI